MQIMNNQQNIKKYQSKMGICESDSLDYNSAAIQFRWVLFTCILSPSEQNFQLSVNL